MFQNFSGSSRRPRQVNLSGQNPNPFAASGWGSLNSGSQQALANAQQERQQRQQEREKLSACKRIQRTWRGHKVRRELADSNRRAWDHIESVQTGIIDPRALLQQLQLLVNFYNPRRRDDVSRLVDLSKKISVVGYSDFLIIQEIQPRLPKLAMAILEALKASQPDCSSELLRLFIAIIGQQPSIVPRIGSSYFSYLSALFTSNVSSSLDKDLMLAALSTSLAWRSEQQAGANYSTLHTRTIKKELAPSTDLLDIYAQFALQFLTTPGLSSSLGGLEDLSGFVDIRVLSTAIIREFSSSVVNSIAPEARLWLLAHFIALHRAQRQDNHEAEFIRALSLQLSCSSAEVLGRIDNDSSASISTDGEEGEGSNYQPVNQFIKDELLTLVDKTQITGLLAKFNTDYTKTSPAGEEDASLLASYALTLLRIFPGRGDEIRMWLYLGSMTTARRTEVPALKFFWQAVSKASIFDTIKADSRAALALLRLQTRQNLGSVTLSDRHQDREWRTILLFLELYTFVLRFTDDEEFLSPNSHHVSEDDGPVSRIRESALPLEDVKRLTIFLKNLAFTAYYNAGELSDSVQNTDERNIGTYFVAASHARYTSQTPSSITQTASKRPFAGIAGMSFGSVKTLVTGVMRMLYERDSRRKFFPRDHWLMTSRFDMEGFIPAVVMEEERQHEVAEDGEGDEEEEDDFDHTRSGLVGMGGPRRLQQIEVLRKAQHQASRQRLMAAVGPRLEVLQNMPFVIPFETRVQIFRQFVLLDQTRRRDGNVDPDIWRMSIIQQARMQDPRATSGHERLGKHHAKIRRDQIFEDAYDQFYELGDGLKEPIQITFVDQFDTIEAGIDGGGVTKEFLTSVTNEAFRSETGSNLFTSNEQNLLYPNPSALDKREQFLKQAGLRSNSKEYGESIKDLLRQYEFLGRVVGKCLYEGILVDIGFAGFFLLKWAASGIATTDFGGYRASINDLRDLDEGLYQGLLKLKNYPGNVEDFDLDFSITDTISYPGSPTLTIERELIPGGSKIPVTNENRPLYVSYVARHRLQIQPYRQTQAFLKGLGDIIKPTWLSMFNQSELQTLIAGEASEIDVEDLRENTQYGGVYQIGDDGQEHHTIQLFWEVLKDLNDQDRRKLLKYVTSTPRAPLMGFSQLNPRFSIRDAGGDEERLPSTSTCVNLLKLPRYSTASILKRKLLYAVNSGAGFDLS